MDDSLNTGRVPEFYCCRRRLDFRYFMGGSVDTCLGIDIEWMYAVASCSSCGQVHEYGHNGTPEAYQFVRYTAGGYQARPAPGGVKKASTAFWLILRHSFEPGYDSAQGLIS